jgi:nicotinate-nucleotide adenylyltransferase
MSKVALFGGTFDPIHLGHSACIQHLVEKMDFTDVIIIPTSQNPLKTESHPVSKENRLKMIELALEDFATEIKIDETEINKDQTSYTIDTIKRYQNEFSSEELFFVMGLDSFSEFDQWKDFSEIIKMTNLIIVSRPPYRRPFSVDELPKGLQEYVQSYDRGYALLDSDRSIEFVTIKTDDISSSLVRKKLKSGKSVDHLIDINVENYIKENSIYPILSADKVDYLTLTHFIGAILKERAMNCSGYDLTPMAKLYDYTLVASATSTKQAQSFATIIKDEVKIEFGVSPFVIEGLEEGRWVILDYGAVLVHIFYDYVRHEYHLEQLWKEGKKIIL